MEVNVRSSRSQRVVAWVIAGLFLGGFFWQPAGMWTGPILAVWFVLSQKPLRGFLWLVGFGLLFGLPGIVHTFLQTIGAHGLAQTPDFAAAVLIPLLVGALSLTIHRLLSPRLPGFVSTLPFPMAATLAGFLLTFTLHIGNGAGVLTFFVSWFAAVTVWEWNLELCWSKIKVGETVFTVVCGFAGSIWVILRTGGKSLPFEANLFLAQFCLAALIVLAVWAMLRKDGRQPWADRTEALARMRSPFTGEALRAAKVGRGEMLFSPSGERFPIRRGIPDFRSPQDLSGDNGKYNHVYETIGGFYDDIQRVFCALKGFDLRKHFNSYMSILEVKPGDAVLETSVGTGLNFQYLPRGVKLTGLDLSPEMLMNCERNLRRWDLQADLCLGNAESLPFADESFDVVFHVGGINFFNDRAKAIREMIRVAKPGSLLMISDETEKHVREVYEKQPGSMWKDRKEPVKPPVDLIPPEMKEVQLIELRDGDTYTLTFRKPLAVGQPLRVACLETGVSA
jgi:ubiquinone/menaquinone biosynthesis C-methylase UbiE